MTKRRRGTKRKRRTRRRRKSELEKTSEFMLDTGKLMIQTAAVLSIAKVASDVIKK